MDKEIKIECKYHDKKDKTNYHFYSIIQLDYILNMEKDDEFKSKFQNFILKLGEVSNKLVNGIDGEVTNAMLFKELENIFNILDQLNNCIYVIDKYYKCFKNNNDDFSKKLLNNVIDKFKIVKNSYINIFEIFDHEIYIELDDLILSNTILNFIDKDKIGSNNEVK